MKFMTILSLAAAASADLATWNVTIHDWVSNGVGNIATEDGWKSVVNFDFYIHDREEVYHCKEELIYPGRDIPSYSFEHVCRIDGGDGESGNWLVTIDHLSGVPDAKVELGLYRFKALPYNNYLRGTGFPPLNCSEKEATVAGYDMEYDCAAAGVGLIKLKADI